MKLNKYFTLCYSLYFNILHYPRVFTHLAPHLYFPFPTESRSKNRKSLSVKDFRFSLLHFWRVFGEINVRPIKTFLYYTDILFKNLSTFLAIGATTIAFKSILGLFRSTSHNTLST